MATSRSQEDICSLVEDSILELETEAGRKPVYNGVVVTDDTLLVIDKNARNFQVYSHNGKLLYTSHRLESGPMGVCLISKTEVAVCLEYRKILILSLKSVDDVKLVKTLRVMTGFDECQSVAKWNSDKLVVSGVKWDDDAMFYWCVVNLTDGRVDSTHNICKGDIDSWTHLAIKHNKVYISCWTDDSITTGVYAYDIFNPHTHKFLYQHRGWRPGSVMADERNFIYVIDLNSNSIHQLTDSGQLVTIHTVSSSLDGIFYDDQHGILYTTSYGSNVITVYRLEYLHQTGIPIEILNMDDRSIQLFEEALKDGRETVYSIRIMVVGHIGVGKTTLVKRLLGEEVNICNRCSTEGIDVYVNCCDVSLSTHEWTRRVKDSEQDYRLQRLARVLNEKQSMKDKATHEEQVIIPPQGETTHKSQEVSYNAVQGKVSEVLYIRSPQRDVDQDHLSTASQEEESHPSLAQREPIQSETSTMAMLKLLQENVYNLNVYNLKQDTGKTFPLTVWDFAGQFAFYTTHQTFLTRQAIYLLVSDVSEQLSDFVADEFYFDSQGMMKCKVHDSEQDYRLQRLARVLNEKQSIKDKATHEEQVIIPPQGEITHKNQKVAHVAFEDEESDVLYSSPQQDRGQDILSTASQQEESHPALAQREPIQCETSTMAMLKLLQENVYNLKQDTGKTFPLTVWDFAGQYAFYTTHQTFLTRQAIYLLVSDVSEQLSDFVADEFYFDSQGMMKCKVHELTEVWLNSIHSCAPFPEAGMPPVILVGTHVDKLSQKQSSAKGTAPETQTKKLATVKFTPTSEATQDTTSTKEQPRASAILRTMKKVFKLQKTKEIVGATPISSIAGASTLPTVDQPKRKRTWGFWPRRKERVHVDTEKRCVADNRPNTAAEIVVNKAEYSTPARVEDDSSQEILIALYSYMGNDPDELSFSEGDKLICIEKSDSGWWLARNSQGEVGLVPSNYVHLQGYSYKMCERYFRGIRSYLRDKPTRFHLVDEDFAINNTVVDPRLAALKRKIVEVASQQPYWGEVRPARWIPLEQELMRLRSAGIKVIPWNLLEDLNKALALPLATEELDLFLRFQHDIGTVLYFSMEILKRKIILDPKWMIDALKSLITAEMFVLRSIPAVTEKWYEFKEKGKLSLELVDALWTKEKCPDLHDNKEHILKLMEQLNIIAKLRVFSEEASEIKEENCFLAPCMLSQTTPREVMYPEPHPQMGSSSVLCYVFVGKYLPSPIFHRLLAACVAHWPIATKKNEKTIDNLIFCGCCVFQLDNVHKLTIHFRDYIIYMRVTRMGIKDRTPSSKLCMEARQFVSDTLIKIIGYLGQSLKFEYFIQCPEYTGDSINSLIPVSLLKEDPEVCCEFHNNMIESYKLLHFWFEDTGSQGEKGEYTADTDIKDQILSQAHDVRDREIDIPSKLDQSKGVPCSDPKLLYQILNKSQQAASSSQSRLEENCLSVGLEFHGETPVNGNCFFEAVSSQLQRLNCVVQKSPQQLRQEVVAFMRTNRVLHAPEGTIHLDSFIYGETFEDYCTRMARDGEWADHVVVVAMARKLQMDIMIVTSAPSASPEDIIVWVDGQTDFCGKPILLGHIWESHYLSLQPIDPVIHLPVLAGSSTSTQTDVSTPAPTADVMQAPVPGSTPSTAFGLTQASTSTSSPSTMTASAPSPTSGSETSDVIQISTSSSATADIMQIPASVSTTTDVMQALASRSTTTDLIQSPSSGSTTSDIIHSPASGSTTAAILQAPASVSTTTDVMTAITSASTPSTTDDLMQAPSVSTLFITNGFIPSPTSTYTTADVMQTTSSGSTTADGMHAPSHGITTADIKQAPTSGTTASYIMQAPAKPFTTPGPMPSPTSSFTAAGLLHPQILNCPPSTTTVPIQVTTSSSPPSTTGGSLPAPTSNFTAAGLLEPQTASSTPSTTGDPMQTPTSGSTSANVTQPPSVGDTDRFMHIACLLVNVGSRILRRLLLYHTVTPACTLDQYLAKERIDIDDLRKRKILNKSQMDILFPKGGSTNLGDYDITLLSALFTNIVITVSPQELNMIEFLRDKRNEIFAHAKSVAVNSNDYQTFWNDICRTLEALSKHCNDPDFENEILREIQGIQVSTVQGTSFLDTLQACPRRIETLERLVQDLISSQSQASKKESDDSDS